MAGIWAGLLGTASLVSQAQGNLTLATGSGANMSVSLTGHTPNPFSVYAGSFNGTLVGGPASYPTSFEAFCVDINAAAHVGAPAYAINLTTTNSLTNGGRVAWLYNNALFLYSQHTNISSNAADQRSGLQLAIWNVLYDTDNTVSSGTFSVDIAPANSEALANLFLTDSIAKTANGTQLKDASGHSYQAFIGPSTPEPGALAYLSVFSGGCLFALRGRFRKTRMRKG